MIQKSYSENDKWRIDRWDLFEICGLTDNLIELSYSEGDLEYLGLCIGICVKKKNL